METDIARLAAALERFPQLQLAILFGSLAEGRERVDSDIDIAVLADSELDAGLRMRLINTIAGLTGRAVDLVDLRRVGEPLLGEVLRGRRILGSDESWAALLSRHLIDAADFGPLQRRLLAERRRAWLG